MTPTISELESGIIDRLGRYVRGVPIEPFPDDPANYRLRHQRGAILVGYRGSEYEESQELDEVVQFRTMGFDILLLSRNLSSHTGAYRHLEAIRAVLTGYVADGFEPMRVRAERYLGHTDGVWSWVVTVAARCWSIEMDLGELEEFVDSLYEDAK